jgi:hypothetical protein
MLLLLLMMMVMIMPSTGSRAERILGQLDCGSTYYNCAGMLVMPKQALPPPFLLVVVVIVAVLLFLLLRLLYEHLLFLLHFPSPAPALSPPSPSTPLPSVSPSLHPATAMVEPNVPWSGRKASGIGLIMGQHGMRHCFLQPKSQYWMK